MLLSMKESDAHALLGAPGRAAAEPPPEITRIRISAAPAICAAPQFAAAPLLKAEGFNEVEYVPVDTGPEPTQCSYCLFSVSAFTSSPSCRSASASSALT